jgi:hypothetical protein
MGPNAIKQSKNYSAEWVCFLLRRVNFQNCISKNFYSENESRVKIIAYTDFVHSVNCRVELF